MLPLHISFYFTLDHLKWSWAHRRQHWLWITFFNGFFSSSYLVDAKTGSDFWKCFHTELSNNKSYVFLMQYQPRPSGSLPFNIGFQSCPLCAEISLHFVHWVSCTWCNYAHTPFHKMVNLFLMFTSERPSLLLYSPFRYKSGTDLLPLNLISYKIFYKVCYFNFYLLFFCLLMPLYHFHLNVLLASNLSVYFSNQ